MQQVAVGRGLDVGQAVEDLSEDHRDLAPSQVSPKAEVGAGSAEADVHIGTPANVEVERVGEHRRVAIGGEVEHADLVSSSDGLIPDVGVDYMPVRRMYVTGLASRTISSTAVGAIASKSAAQIAR